MQLLQPKNIERKTGICKSPEGNDETKCCGKKKKVIGIEYDMQDYLGQELELYEPFVENRGHKFKGYKKVAAPSLTEDEQYDSPARVPSGPRS